MVSLIQYICNYWCRNKIDNNNLLACKYCVHLFKEQQWASISMLWVTWKPVKLWREWELRGLSIEGGKIRGYYGLTFARTLTGKRETYWAAGTEIGEQRSPEGSFFFFFWLVWWPLDALFHVGWDIFGIFYFKLWRWVLLMVQWNGDGFVMLTIPFWCVCNCSLL